MNRDRALDQVKAAAFTDSNAAFLGCLICNLNFSWSKTATQTACVSDTNFYWNPDWFDSLTKEERKGVLMHELWHLALLHGLRGESKDNHRKWNVACDIRINENLLAEGYILPDGACLDEQFKDPNILEEEIYNLIDVEPDPQSWGSGDLSVSDAQVGIVQSAMAASKFAGKTPGNVEEVLRNFLKPKLPWKQILHKYLLDKIEPGWTWTRPNKRYRDMYMPSFLPQEGRLTHIAMFLDTSGSISEEDSKRFVSEVKYVQEVLNPDKLTIVQFDTDIQDEMNYTADKPFKSLTLKGFGGTDYECIRQYILKYKPTASIIFTDLYADPMESVGKSEIIWVIKGNSKDAPMGKSIHVD